MPSRSHSPAAQDGVALVEPERDPHGDRLVQREMGELVAEGADEVVLVGAEEDGPRARHRDGGAPRRCAAGGERVEQVGVGNHDEPKRPRVAQAKPRPLGRPVGEPREVGRDRSLGGPGHGRDPTDLHRGGAALKEEEG